MVACDSGLAVGNNAIQDIVCSKCAASCGHVFDLPVTGVGKVPGMSLYACVLAVFWLCGCMYAYVPCGCIILVCLCVALAHLYIAFSCACSWYSSLHKRRTYYKPVERDKEHGRNDPFTTEDGEGCLVPWLHLLPYLTLHCQQLLCLLPNVDALLFAVHRARLE